MSHERTSALVRRSSWPGWIWAVPVAALLAAGWLLFQHFATRGTNVEITFTDVHGLDAQNGQVMYRGLKVGKVDSIALTHDGKSVEVRAMIDDDATRYLRSGTVFWLRGTHPSLSDLSSLGTLLSGPEIVMQPGLGAKVNHFQGLDHEPTPNRNEGAAQRYIAVFQGPVGALKPGDPIKLRGFTVGHIGEVSLRFDQASGTLSTPVTLDLYPGPFNISAGPKAMSAAIQALVANGLRAQLSQDPPIVGSFSVILAMMPKAPAATIASDQGLPELPTAPSSGLGAVMDQLGKVQIGQIGQNILSITRHVNQLVSSPKLKDSIVQLDETLRQIRLTAHNTAPQITELVTSLRHTAIELDSTSQDVRKTLGNQSQNGLPQTMQEITGAARSIRALADYLDRHPEALIRGKSGG